MILKECIHLIVIGVTLGLTACGGGGNSDSTNSGASAVSKMATVSAIKSGTLKSDDGKLTIDIPAGATSTETTLSVKVGSASDAPPGIKNANVVYVLEPDGIVFGKPLSVTLKVSATKNPDGSYSVPVIEHVESDGTITPINDLAIAVETNAGTANATFSVNGFSSIVVTKDKWGSIAGPSTATGIVGVPFSIDLTTVWAEDGGIPGAETESPGYIVEGITQCSEFKNSSAKITAGVPQFTKGQFVCVDTGKTNDPIAYASDVGPLSCGSFGYHIDVTCQTNPNISYIADDQDFGNGITMIMTLVINGKLYPRQQFFLDSSGPGCDSNHWHTNLVTVYTIGVPDNINTKDLNGISDTAPNACGFGKESDVKQRPLVLTTAEWQDFVSNH